MKAPISAALVLLAAWSPLRAEDSDNTIRAKLADIYRIKTTDTQTHEQLKYQLAKAEEDRERQQIISYLAVNGYPSSLVDWSNSSMEQLRKFQKDVQEWLAKKEEKFKQEWIASYEANRQRQLQQQQAVQRQQEALIAQEQATAAQYGMTVPQYREWRNQQKLDTALQLLKIRIQTEQLDAANRSADALERANEAQRMWRQFGIVK